MAAKTARVSYYPLFTDALCILKMEEDRTQFDVVKKKFEKNYSSFEPGTPSLPCRLANHWATETY